MRNSGASSGLPYTSDNEDAFARGRRFHAREKFAAAEIAAVRPTIGRRACIASTSASRWRRSTTRPTRDSSSTRTITKRRWPRLSIARTERKGFVLVTGEIGSGKTLLSRLLISRLPAGTRSAVITNTRLSGVELLRAICSEFSLDVASLTTAAELGRVLEKFLLEQYARDRLAVLILDEAQNLPPESFEEVRMLSNLEADNAKLLQILVLGQPELQDTFRRRT